MNTIGKQPFKEFVNSHRVDIQTSLISSYNPTYVRPTESTEPVLLDVSESETDIAKLLNSSINPESLTMHNLRKVLNFAIKDSTSELKIIFRNLYKFINHLTICN